jgi:hypothetical protein
LLLSEAAFGHCKKGNIVICPADVAVYYAQTLTCESSSFFKTGSTYPLCRRTLIVHHSTHTLQRYDMLRVYQFTRPHRVTPSCTRSDRQVPRTLTLEGSGLLRNFEGCHISSPELQAYSELHGTTYAKLEAPIFYLPDISVLNDQEHQLIKNIPLPSLQKLNDIHARVTASHNKYDVDSVLHIHQTSLLHERQTNWFIIPFTSLSTLISLGVPVYLVYTRFRSTYHITRKADAATSTPTPPLEPSKPDSEESTPSVLFTSYSLRQSN